MIEKFQNKFNKKGLTEYEVLKVYSAKESKKNFTAGKIKCRHCGIEEDYIDLNSKVRYNSHCKCISSTICEYCGRSFTPKTKNAKNRKVCYDCNPYIAKDQPNEYKSKMRELNWNKLKQDLGFDGCVICGYNKYEGALDFHHLNPDEKEHGPSSIMHHQYKKVRKEMEKCVVLCSNCHREVHAGITKLEGIDNESYSVK